MERGSERRWLIQLHKYVQHGRRHAIDLRVSKSSYCRVYYVRGERGIEQEANETDNVHVQLFFLHAWTIWCDQR